MATRREYLNDESKDKKGVDFDLRNWTASTPKDIPHQMNGSDCGVFTCMVTSQFPKIIIIYIVISFLVCQISLCGFSLSVFTGKFSTVYRHFLLPCLATEWRL